MNTVLLTMPGYEIKDLIVSPDERRVAGMTEYSARSFIRDGAIAFTTLVSYYDRQTQGKSIHSPRNCLPGAGWEIMSGGTEVVTVDGVPKRVNRYVLRNGAATAIAYYWYQGRGRITANEYQVKWNLLRDAALMGRTEEALVRIVVPVAAPKTPGAPTDPQTLVTADATAQAVAVRMINEVDAILPTRRGRGS